MRSDHGYALTPQRRALGQLQKGLYDVAVGIFVLRKGCQVFAQDVGCAQVDQVPVVNAGRLRQVKIEHLFAHLGRGFLEALHQHQQGAEAALVPGALQQAGRHFLRLFAVAFGHAAYIGHDNAQKLVAFSILTLPGLEKAGQEVAFLRVDIRFQFTLDKGGA